MKGLRPFNRKSAYALSQHSVSDLLEAADVSAHNKVVLVAVLLSCSDAGVEDVNHDVVQTLVNFLEGPAQTQGVLAHFQTGGSYAACVSSLCRAEEYAGCLECCNSLRGGRHVSALSYKLAAVGDQSLCVLLVQLVLGCARQSDVALGAPRTLTLGVNAARYALSVLLDAAALNFLDVLNNIQVDAVWIVDVAFWQA